MAIEMPTGASRLGATRIVSKALLIGRSAAHGVRCRLLHRNLIPAERLSVVFNALGKRLRHLLARTDGIWAPINTTNGARRIPRLRVAPLATAVLLVATWGAGTGPPAIDCKTLVANSDDSFSLSLSIAFCSSVCNSWTELSAPAFSRAAVSRSTFEFEKLK
jgi:hypothetical protein